MMDTAITFSTEYFHENSFSWTLGAFCDDESQNLEFVRTSNSDLSAIHLSIRDDDPSVLECLDDRMTDVFLARELCFPGCILT